MSDAVSAVGTRQRLGAPLIATVIFVTAIAPLATDMYVPAFPRVAGELHASVTEVQLTLTTFFVGMALGQLAGGPISDQRGRRNLLIAGTALITLASLGCALAPTVQAMAGARLLQGIGGGWAMVISRAVIVDLASGSQLVRVLNVVAGVGGLAPVVGPLLGGLLLQVSDWRASFWVLVVAGVVMTVCAAVLVPETLPRDRRHGGGFRTFARAAAAVVGNRRYMGYVLIATATLSVVFAYVSTSAFILEQVNGLTPIQYALDFAGNAAMASVASLLAARLAGRIPTRRVVLIGMLVGLAGAAGLLLGGLLLEAPLVLVLVCFLALMVDHGLATPNAGALASAEVREHPGTGSAVLGLFQWLAAGVTAPIAGLLGTDITVAAGLLAVVGVLLSMVGLLLSRSGAQPAAVAA
jgi:DHA1 family bicyclomycin/chloramphenicol resistance-like MFS transporter